MAYQIPRRKWRSHDVGESSIYERDQKIPVKARFPSWPRRCGIHRFESGIVIAIGVTSDKCELFQVHPDTLAHFLPD